MTRDEMLETLKEIINCSSVYGAWSDDLLLMYLSEGQDKFCEDTGFFVDVTNITLTLVPGTLSYDLDDRIIKVLSAWYGNTRLPMVDMEGLVQGAEPEFLYTVPVAGSTIPIWQVDYETGTFTLRSSPSEEMTIKLRVWRYPLVSLNHRNASGQYDTQPEIPARFQFAPIEWAAFKALSHHGAEQQDPVKAADHKAIYDQYAKEGYRAMRRRMRVGINLSPSPVYLAGLT